MAGDYINIKKEIFVEFPLRGFLPKQMEVMKACEKYDAVLYSGAFRAGKTMLLVHVAIKTCLENPKSRGLLGSLTFSSLNNVVFQLFLDELDKYQEKLNKAGVNLQLATRVLHSQTKMQVEFYNGSILYFRPCDEERKLAGYTLDFFGLDEPVDMDETIFNQLMGRISGTGNLKNCFGILTTNPANQTHWIYQTFYESGEAGYKHIDTTTYDNVLLPEYDKYIKRLERTWDEDWVRRYLNGTWGTFEGAIYKEFNPELHVGDFKDIPTDYHIAGVDWGLRNPFAIIVAGVTADKRLVIKEEIYGNNKSTHEVAKILLESHKNRHFKKIYVDPSSADLILQGYNHGLPIGEKRRNGVFSYADNDVNSGIARLKSLFKNDVILIDKSCVVLKKQLLGYRYELQKEKPIKKDDHTCISGDTLINTTNGDIPIKDLVGKEGFVYSYMDGNITASKFRNVQKTGHKSTLKITLDDNNTIVCTSDHPFLLRTGEYILADELHVGDSLMPFHCNHKVILIEPYNTVDVYNMYVENSNNFACNGIIVHNCDAIRYLTTDFNPYEDDGVFEYIIHRISKWG